MVETTQLGIMVIITMIIFSLLSNFMPKFGFFTPSITLMFSAIVLSAYVAFGIIQKKFTIDSRKDLVGLLIVSAIIVLFVLFGFGILGGGFFKGSIVELQSMLIP